MAASPHIIDATTQDLPRLIELSRQQPVLVDFWADWCQPCKQMAPLLERLIEGYAGKLLLARVNADTEQGMTEQFGVRSLPTLKLLNQGQLVAELSGAQTEAALREWLLPHVDPEAAEAAQLEEFVEQARAALAAGQADQVVPALEKLLAERPQVHSARALLADHLLAEGQLAAARSLLAEVTDEVDVLKPYHARFTLLEKLDERCGAMEASLSELATAITAPSVSPDSLYLYGMRAVAAGQFREGLEALLVMLRDHGSYQDGLARAALLEVFTCLAKGDPLASEFRRRMFNYLH